MRLARPLAALLALAPCAGSACSSSGGSTTGNAVGEAAKSVLLLEMGTVQEVRSRRGTGPFRDYDVPPRRMLSIVEKVLLSKVVAVFPNRRTGEVIAKERSGKDAADDWYSPAWDSAVVVIVHPVAEDPGRSRVEVHAVAKGVFHGGKIDWEREVPSLLDAAVARKGAPPVTPLK